MSIANLLLEPESKTLEFKRAIPSFRKLEEKAYELITNEPINDTDTPPKEKA